MKKNIDLLVQPAEYKDMDELANLRINFALFEQRYITGMDVNKDDQSFKRDIILETKESFKKKNPAYVIAKDQNNIVGYISVFFYPDFKDKAFIGELYIVPQFRRNGTASALLDFLIEWVKSKNKDILRVSVSKKNLKALKFFKKYQFKKTVPEYINFELKV